MNLFFWFHCYYCCHYFYQNLLIQNSASVLILILTLLLLKCLKSFSELNKCWYQIDLLWKFNFLNLLFWININYLIFWFFQFQILVVQAFQRIWNLSQYSDYNENHVMSVFNYWLEFSVFLLNLCWNLYLLKLLQNFLWFFINS